MCGIVSYFSTSTVFRKDIENLLTQMISVDTLRGQHSTGLMYDQGDEYLPEVYKKAINGHDFVQLKTVKDILKDYERSRFLIGHNRAATAGVINNHNAHPFQHGNITGVHNGTITNHRTLTTQTFDVDSEYIFHALSENDSKDVIPKIHGAFNLLWHDAYDDTMHMVRNEDRPYVFAEIVHPVHSKDVTIIGASEEGMLKWLANRNDITLGEILKPKLGMEYVFDLATLGKPRVIHHKLHERVVYQSNSSNYGAGVSRGRQGGGPANRGKVSGGTVSDITSTIIDFYLLAWTEDMGSHNKDLGTWRGLDENGTPIILHRASYNDLKVRQWYSGTSYYKNPDTGVRHVSPTTVKKIYKAPLVPAQEGTELTDDDKFDCIVCKDEYSNKDLVFVDDAPVCNSCIVNYDTTGCVLTTSKKDDK